MSKMSKKRIGIEVQLFEMYDATSCYFRLDGRYNYIIDFRQLHVTSEMDCEGIRNMLLIKGEWGVPLEDFANNGRYIIGNRYRIKRQKEIEFRLPLGNLNGSIIIQREYKLLTYYNKARKQTEIKVLTNLNLPEHF